MRCLDSISICLAYMKNMGERFTNDHYLIGYVYTVLILSFQIDMCWLPREQSDQGLHCLPFLLNALLYVKTTLFKF